MPLPTLTPKISHISLYVKFIIDDMILLLAVLLIIFNNNLMLKATNRVIRLPRKGLVETNIDTQ